MDPVLNPELRRKLVRIARIVNRADRWSRLAWMEDSEAELLLREHEEAEEAKRVSEEPKDKKSCNTPGSSARRSPFVAAKADAPQETSEAYAPKVKDDLDGEAGEEDMIAETLRLDQDDGTYPAGPRADKNKSRYQVSPGHGEGLSDLLRSTAAARAASGIQKILGSTEV